MTARQARLIASIHSRHFTIERILSVDFEEHPSLGKSTKIYHIQYAPLLFTPEEFRLLDDPAIDWAGQIYLPKKLENGNIEVSWKIKSEWWYMVDDTDAVIQFEKTKFLEEQLVEWEKKRREDARVAQELRRRFG